MKKKPTKAAAKKVARKGAKQAPAAKAPAKRWPVAPARKAAAPAPPVRKVRAANPAKGKPGAGKKAARKLPAKAAKAAGKRAPEMGGRPSKYSPELLAKITEQLSRGVPMAVICRGEEMPAPSTVWRWSQEDEEVSQSIARAREEGFDVIAYGTLAIAEDRTRDLLSSEFGDKPNTAAVMRDKLIIDTRMNLLAKWDPKRYGARVAAEISGPGGKAVAVAMAAELSPEQEARIVEAARIAAALVPPGCLEGVG